MAQITSVTSESLQAKIRELLPSQQGFGEDLQASNVILPVIDLTAAAEGSSTPQYQAQAIAFGSQTAFDVNNTTTAIASSPGFYRVTATVNVQNIAIVSQNPHLTMDDGLSTKKVWGIFVEDRITEHTDTVIPVDLIFFLATGITLSAVSDNTTNRWFGSVRQVADVNGTIINPIGFSPQ